MQYINEMCYKPNIQVDEPNHNGSPFFVIDGVVMSVCLLADVFVNNPLMLIVLITYLTIRFYYSSVATNFALLLLLIPNLGIMLMRIVGLSIPILNIFICFALLKLVMTFRHYKISKAYIFTIGSFVAYEWGHAIIYDLKSLFLLISWSSAVIYVSLFFLYSEETYNHLIAIKYFITGVIVSTVFGVVDFLDRYGTLFNNNATIRFHGGAGDANYYSMYIMIAMFCMLFIVNVETKKISKIVYPILFIFFMAFGLLSLSRMFIIVVSLLCLFLLLKVFFSVRKSNRLVTFIIILATYLTLLMIYFNKELMSIINLLSSRFVNFIDDPAALTSNRNIIAEQYLQLITSDNVRFIFGIGIQDYHIRSGVYLETHNILLELLVAWGIVGIIIFLIYIGTFFRNRMLLKRSSEKTDFIGWLPLLCMGVSLMSLNALSNESFFLLLVFALNNIYEYK